MTSEAISTLATNLRRRRSQLGLSQDALADLAGVHRTYVGAVEREEKNITIKSLEKIANALHIEIWRLMAPALGERHG